MHNRQLRPGGPALRTRTAPLDRRSAHARPLARLPLWALLLTLAAAGCDSPTAPGPSLSVDEAPRESREAFALINEHRASLGCSTLKWHERSATVGEDYARLMSDEAFFGHVAPGGSTLKSRLNRAGISGYRVAAETIAAGQRTATKVVGDWILSPGHRAILEDCQYTHAGIGFHTGDGPYRAYWTAVFLAAR